MERIGKYELRRFLGQGGFGRVYEAWDPALERRVAIKTCQRSGTEGREDRERFLREARIAARLDHENITRIFDLGYDNDYEVEYVVQEYLPGQDLHQMIHTRAAVPPAVRLHYLRQIAAGLEHAHGQHVVHRDIKPTNIRVLPDHRVKILDFGIAKEMMADPKRDLTGTGVTMGTLAYSAPEQMYSSRQADARADIFSFGVVAYELLAYEHPFPGGNVVHKVQHTEPLPLSDHWPECPEALERMVHLCMRKRRKQRYQSVTALMPDLLEQAGHFSDELHEFLSGAPLLTSLSSLVHERDVMPTRVVGPSYTTGRRRLPPPPRHQTSAVAPSAAAATGSVASASGLAVASSVEAMGSVSPTAVPAEPAYPRLVHTEPRTPNEPDAPQSRVQVPVLLSPSAPPEKPPEVRPRPVAQARFPRGLLLVSLVIVLVTLGLTWHAASRNGGPDQIVANSQAGVVSPKAASPEAASLGTGSPDSASPEGGSLDSGLQAAAPSSVDGTSEAADLPRLRLTGEVEEAGIRLRAEAPARPLAASVARYKIVRDPAWSFGERQYVAARSAVLDWADDRDLVSGQVYRYHVEAVSEQRQALAQSRSIEVAYASARPIDSQ